MKSKDNFFSDEFLDSLKEFDETMKEIENTPNQDDFKSLDDEREEPEFYGVRRSPLGERLAYMKAGKGSYRRSRPTKKKHRKNKKH